MVKVGGDYVYPLSILRRQFAQIKAECHRNGLAFIAVKTGCGRWETA